MCEWKGVAGRSFMVKVLVVLTVFTLAWLSIMTDGAVDVLICAAMVYVLITVVAVFIYSFIVSSVSDHVFSLWDIDADVVCWRIDQAIKRQVPRNVIEYRGGRTIFHISPMSIIVAAGHKRTRVYVGPVTSENGDKVEALKAFVDAALGKRR